MNIRMTTAFGLIAACGLGLSACALQGPAEDATGGLVGVTYEPGGTGSRLVDGLGTYEWAITTDSAAPSP